jgi:hypothetical protein
MDGRRKWLLRVLYSLWPTLDCDLIEEDIDHELSVRSYCIHYLHYSMHLIYDLQSLMTQILSIILQKMIN